MEASVFSESAGGEDVAALEEEAGRKFVYAIRFTVVCVLLGMAIKIFPSLGKPLHFSALIEIAIRMLFTLFHVLQRVQVWYPIL